MRRARIKAVPKLVGRAPPLISSNCVPHVSSVTNSVTDSVTKSVTDLVTDRLTDNLTDRVTDRLIDNLTDRVNDNVTDSVTDRVTGKVTDRLTDNVTDNVTDRLTDNLNDNVTDSVTGKVTDRLTDKVTDILTDNLNDKVTDSVTDSVTDKVTDSVTDRVNDKVTDSVTDKVTDSVTDKVTDSVTDKVTDSVTDGGSEAKLSDPGHSPDERASANGSELSDAAQVSVINRASVGGLSAGDAAEGSQAVPAPGASSLAGCPDQRLPGGGGQRGGISRSRRTRPNLALLRHKRAPVETPVVRLAEQQSVGDHCSPLSPSVGPDTAPAAAPVFNQLTEAQAASASDSGDYQSALTVSSTHTQPNSELATIEGATVCVDAAGAIYIEDTSAVVSAAVCESASIDSTPVAATTTHCSLMPPPDAPQSSDVTSDRQVATLSDVDLYLRKRFSSAKRRRPVSVADRSSELKDIMARTDDGKPIRSKMRMRDLILWNPDSQPMSTALKTDKKRGSRRSSCHSDSGRSVDDPVAMETVAEDGRRVSSGAVSPLPPSAGAADATACRSSVEPDEDADEPEPVPQIKIAADGSVVIDESSLVVKSSEEKRRAREVLSEPVLHDNTDFRVSFNGYKRRRVFSGWSVKETARFYKALSCVGTDFSLMQQVFPHRSRLDLKRKYKREERVNSLLIAHSLRADMQFDLSVLDDDWEGEIERCKAEAQRIKQETKIIKKEQRAKDVQARRESKALLKKSSKSKKAAATASDTASTDTLLTDISKGDAPGSRRLSLAPCPAAAAAPPSHPAAASDRRAPRRYGGRRVLAPCNGAGSGGAPAPPADQAATICAAAGDCVSSGQQLPEGLVQLSHEADQLTDQLLIVATPSEHNPDRQLLHVYLVQPQLTAAQQLPQLTAAQQLPQLTAAQQLPQLVTTGESAGGGAVGDGVDVSTDEVVVLDNPS